MSRETRMQWDIFQDILKANEIVNHREKIFLLKTAVGKAEELSRLYPNDQANWLLRTRLRLAEAYVELSEFETTALLAKVSLNNAIHLLEEDGEADDSEKRYLALIDAYQHRGDYLYQAGRYEEAQEDYETAVDYYDQAESKLTTSEQENYNNQVLGPIYEAQAKIALLNKADNLASNKLDRANELLKDGINASVYGHLSLLRADTATAVSDYLAGIVDENQMGEVLSFIDLMAEAIPQDKKYYLNFKTVLLETVCRKNPDFERDAIQYFYALDKQNLMAARFQWDEVLTWSDTVLRCAERMTNPIDAPLVWRDRWLNAHINQAYYLLMAKGNDTGVLERSIQYSEKAIRFVETNYNSYENISFLRTNYAHALYLVGEKAKAIEQYKLFVDNGTRGFAIQQYDPWEILEKDFRDLTAEGIRIPDLPDLIHQLDPDKVFSAEQWSDMGVQEPPNE
jgi:tetratricopeptide (TPR) repeat protein